MLSYTLYSDAKETFPCDLSIARRLICSLASDTRLRLSERTNPHKPVSIRYILYPNLTAVQDSLLCKY